MISDVLSDAVIAIDRYLSETVYDDVYTGSLRIRIRTLRDKMDELRAELDAPPPCRPNCRPNCRDMDALRQSGY